MCVYMHINTHIYIYGYMVFKLMFTPTGWLQWTITGFNSSPQGDQLVKAYSTFNWWNLMLLWDLDSSSHLIIRNWSRIWTLLWTMDTSSPWEWCPLGFSPWHGGTHQKWRVQCRKDSATRTAGLVLIPVSKAGHWITEANGDDSRPIVQTTQIL